VLVCGGWDTGPGYPRPLSLIGALRNQGFDVAECRVEMPFSGAEKRRVMARPWLWPQVALRSASARRELDSRLREAIRVRTPDAVLVPYPGHLVVRWVRSVFDGKVVLDLFLSAYDTVVLDRRRFRPGSVAARWLRRLDRRACEAADLVLLDTPDHAEHVAELTGTPPSRFDWVPITDAQAPAAAAPYPAPEPGGELAVLFFGTGVPLHGLPHLIEAVRRSAGVRLSLVGGSPAERELARRLLGDRLRLLPEFVTREQIGAELDRCHLVAGVFGDSAKAECVVPYKVIHGLAAGRPVLTADTPAIRRLLSPGVDCLTCPAAEPEALAAVLAAVRADPSELPAIARAGRTAFETRFSAEAVGQRLSAVLERVGVAAPPLPVSSPRPTVATT
jgi:glycosyltransferase involved in cell wall biosynthesis